MTASARRPKKHVRVQRRNPLGLPALEDLKEVWDRRELALVLAKRDIHSRYRQAWLGSAWAILQPLLHVSMLSIFFGLLARVPSEGVPYFIFCLTGMLVWQYFSATVSVALLNLSSISVMLKKVYFPRLVLPVAATIPQLVDLVITLAIAIILVTCVFHYGSVFSILWLPLFVLLAMVTAFGTVCWFQALSILFFDTRHLIPLIMQLWLICSPVMYSVSIIPEAYRPLYWLNPIATAVAGARWSILNVGDPPSPFQLLSILTALILAVSGGIFYERVSKWFGDLI